MTAPVWGEPDGGDPIEVVFTECVACGEIEHNEYDRQCESCGWPDREEE
jgi:ribosomal protein L37E